MVKTYSARYKNLKDVIWRMRYLSRVTRRPASTRFNGIEVRANPRESLTKVEGRYKKAENVINVRNKKARKMAYNSLYRHTW